MNYRSVFGDEEPAEVFKYFAMLSEIPRRSGDQRRVSDFLLEFGRSLGLQLRRDDALNVVIEKSASGGYEAREPLILQAHMDMVCEKRAGVAHDFVKDPIRLLRDGDAIRADGTSLGADNGVGVAFIMALLADAAAKHPPLEAVFTTDEETDMAGAWALDLERLNGRTLINLDTAAVTVCGAGELEVEMRFAVDFEPIRADSVFRTVVVGGLHGGHSGQDATKERGNAVVLLHRILRRIDGKTPFQLVSIQGGAGMSSAFARDARAVLALPPGGADAAAAAVEQCGEVFREELRLKDPDVRVEFVSERGRPERAFGEESYHKLSRLLALLPDGVASRNFDFENAMESCSNVGVVETEQDGVFSTILIRSVGEAKKYLLYEKVIMLCDLLGVSHTIARDIPHWKNSVDEALLAKATKCYPDRKPGISQGTLECGIFLKKRPDLSVIALGSPYYYPHSPNEYFSIGETGEYWRRLKRFLEI